MAGNNFTIGGGGIHHVALKVKDFDASVKFYTEGLGFKVKMAWGEGDSRAIMLDTGDGGCFEVFAGGESCKPEGQYLHVAFYSNDVDKAIKRAVEYGAAVTMPPTDVDIQSSPPTPVRIAFCKGPDGELLEFFHQK